MKGCLFDGAPGPPCFAPLQPHHLVPQQRIKRRWRTLNAAYRRGSGVKPWSLKRCLEDQRNIVRVCWGHHQRVEARLSAHVTRDQLPAGFYDFVREYELHADVPAEFDGPDNLPSRACAVVDDVTEHIMGDKS